MRADGSWKDIKAKQVSAHMVTSMIDQTTNPADARRPELGTAFSGWAYVTLIDFKC